MFIITRLLIFGSIIFLHFIDKKKDDTEAVGEFSLRAPIRRKAAQQIDPGL
jgi:hypothetical protein